MKLSTIQKKATKLGIPFIYVEKIPLPLQSIYFEDWVEVIESIKTKYPNYNKRISIEDIGYDGAVDNIFVCISIPYDEQKLKEVIHKEEERLAAIDNKIRDKELAEFERLKKKYNK